MLDNETAEEKVSRYKKELLDIEPYITVKPKFAERKTFLLAEIARISGVPATP